MTDRVPTYKGRVTLEPVDGQEGYYDMVRADEPTVEGTILNKSSLLSDETAAMYGLDEDGTVNDCLAMAGCVVFNGFTNTSSGGYSITVPAYSKYKRTSAGETSETLALTATTLTGTSALTGYVKLGGFTLSGDYS